MIQTVNLHDFRQAFHDCGRGEQFSYEALGLIFDWFEQLEQDTGTPYELDVIALCCDISERSTDDIRADYELDTDTDVLKYLNHHTSVIGDTSDAIIFIQF